MPLVDQQAGGTLLARVGTIRRQIAAELGMVIPPVRIRDDVGLDSHEYVMRVRGTEVARGGVMAGHHMAMNPGDAMGQLPGIPTTEPAFGLPAVWIPESGRAEAEALGWTVVDAESVVVTHLTEMIRAHASELLTRQETRHLLDQLKEVNEAVVSEIVPDVLSLGEVQRVLQALLREGVSIRDLGAVLEAIGDKARLTRDPAMLAEYARQALGRTITAPFLDQEGTLHVIALDPTLEQSMAEALVQTADGEFLAMDPTQAAHVVESAAEQVEYAHRGRRPPGAAVLGARAPAPAPAVRAAAAAARGLLLQRDRPGYRGRDNGRDRAGDGGRRVVRRRRTWKPPRATDPTTSRRSAGAASKSCCRRSGRSSGRTRSCCAAAKVSAAGSEASSSVPTSRSTRARRTATSARSRSARDRATVEGLSSPAVQALFEQATPFADALAAASRDTRMEDDTFSATVTPQRPDPEPRSSRRRPPIEPDAGRRRSGLYGPQPNAAAIAARAPAPEPEPEPEPVAAPAPAADDDAGARPPPPTPPRSGCRRRPEPRAGRRRGRRGGRARAAVLDAAQPQEADPHRARAPHPGADRARAGPAHDRGDRRRRRRQDVGRRPPRRGLRRRPAPTSR